MGPCGTYDALVAGLFPELAPLALPADGLTPHGRACVTKDRAQSAACS
jgi:hypothetical protein